MVVWVRVMRVVEAWWWQWLGCGEGGKLHCSLAHAQLALLYSLVFA